MGSPGRLAKPFERWRQAREKRKSASQKMPFAVFAMRAKCRRQPPAAFGWSSDLHPKPFPEGRERTCGAKFTVCKEVAMEGSVVSKLVFALVTAVTVMAASWGLQRMGFFRQAKLLVRVLSMAGTIFVVTFALALVWPW
jgi:hypothetical protein